jgi:hypothetical protein
MRARPPWLVTEDAAVGAAKLSGARSTIIAKAILDAVYLDTHVVHTEHVLHQLLSPRQIIPTHSPLSSPLLIKSHGPLPVDVEINRDRILGEAWLTGPMSELSAFLHGVVRTTIGICAARLSHIN